MSGTKKLSKEMKKLLHNRGVMLDAYYFNLIEDEKGEGKFKSIGLFKKQESRLKKHSSFRFFFKLRKSLLDD